MQNQAPVSPSKLSTANLPQHPTVSPSLMALPSLTHSLSSLPKMTVLPKDLLHYGTLGTDGATRDLSEAKLDLALRKPKRPDTATGEHLPALYRDGAAHPIADEDDQNPITFSPKRNKDRSGPTNSTPK